MDARRVELRLTWIQVAERAHLHRDTINQVRDGGTAHNPLTARAIEAALEWKQGSLDAIDNNGEPTPLDTPTATATQPEPEGPANSFDAAFAEYRASLRRLRLAAEADQGVDPDVRALIEDLTLIAYGMIYGGAPGGRQAIRDVAEGDKHEALGETDSHRTA